MERPFVVVTISLLATSDLPIYGRANEKTLNGFANKILHCGDKTSVFFPTEQFSSGVKFLTKLKSHNSSATYSISIVTEICSKLPRKTLDSTDVRANAKKKKIWNVPQSQKLPTFRFPHAVGWCEAQTKPSQIQNARRRRWLDPIFFFFHFNSRFLCCSWMIRICVYALWTIRIQGLYTNGVNIFFAFLPSISHSLESGPLLLLSENCVFVVPVSVCVSAGVVAVLCTSAYSMPSGKKLHIYYHLMRQFWRAAKLSSFSIYIYLKLQFWAPCSAVQCAP